MESRLRRRDEAPLTQGSMSIEYLDDTVIMAEGAIVNEVQKHANAALDIVSGTHS